MTTQEVIELVTLLVALLPIALRIFVALGQHSHNQKMKNLAERSSIIVAAMEQSNMTNEDKKQAALNKLAIYANEVGIKVTGQQLDDYVESSVKFLKLIQEGKTEIDKVTTVERRM